MTQQAYWEFMRDGEDCATRQSDTRCRKIRVFDGTLVDPYNLTETDMKPVVFIHALSCINRFTGHAIHPYTVGQHTRNLALLVPEHLKRVALVHDFSEALFNDMASPIKQQNPGYRAAEHVVTQQVFSYFGIKFSEHEEFDEYDKRIYINERDALFTGKVDELGMGDARVALDTSRLPQAFAETDWRKIRNDLMLLWLVLFPEFDILTGQRVNV